MWSWICDLCCTQGLEHIHSMGLVHLDIKPENIFISMQESRLPNTMAVISEEATAREQTQLLYKIGMQICPATNHKTRFVLFGGIA